MKLEDLKELIDEELAKGNGDKEVMVFNNNFCSISGFSYDNVMGIYFIDFELEKSLPDDEIYLGSKIVSLD